MDALISKIMDLDHPMWRTGPDGPALADPNGTAWVDSVRNNGWSLSRLFGLNDMDDCSERVDLTWKISQ